MEYLKDLESEVITESVTEGSIIKFDSEGVEIVERGCDEIVPKSKRVSNGRRKYCDLEVLMDCGANHSKAIVRYGDIEQKIHFPSRARIVDGEISPDNIGNFTHEETNFASGKSADYYMGEWIEAREGNKIDYIHVWFIAVLTHAKKILVEASKTRKRKGVVSLRCFIRMLTLSKERKAEIESYLRDIGSFSFNNQKFEVNIGALEVHTEGFGSAVAAWEQNKDAQRINILDMGGGTLSFTSYSTEFGELDESERTIADCGGVNAITAALQLGMSSRDNAGVQLFPELLEKALRMSKSGQVLYDFGEDIENIFPAFTSAMNDWLKINPQVMHLLKKVRFSLMNGERIYLTGGGFASDVIRDFIADFLTRANSKASKTKRKSKKTSGVTIDRELIVPLENGHTLNITGLKRLPSLVG